MSQPGTPPPPPLPPPVGGGTFQVDISRAPEAIRDLEAARDELRAIKDEATTLGQVHPPARDQVSLDAAQVLGQAAVEGPNSFVRALNDGINEITRMIDALHAGFSAYQQSDEESSLQFRRQP